MSSTSTAQQSLGLAHQRLSDQKPGRVWRPATEKSAFDLKLEKYDAVVKIKIIKEMRTFMDLGLKEAKELVEKVPVVNEK
ncbi:50s ribosomal protein l7/l12 [Quercus suber]|uniref:50s ribosomal protein l7/l12 n=1 Tax=Quercus suber TaxID=58331 RepID=A0AAW0I6U0_QUESU